MSQGHNSFSSIQLASTRLITQPSLRVRFASRRVPRQLFLHPLVILYKVNRPDSWLFELYRFLFLSRSHVCLSVPERALCVRESTKVLDSGSQPLVSGSQHLDSGFQPSGFRIPYQSGFQIPNHCGFRILVSVFRIPTEKICWIPDSGFSYMGRPHWLFTYIRSPVSFNKILLLVAGSVHFFLKCMKMHDKLFKPSDSSR